MSEHTKAVSVVILALLGCVALAALLIFNVPFDVSILIEADDNTMEYLMLNERPHIHVKSLATTPLDDIKLLTVSAHYTWTGKNGLTDEVSDWLCELGVKNYPDIMGKMK